MQKRILCYGDSNTYGYIPTGGRYDAHTRWPMRMQAVLGDGYTVIEEGFNGRTCVFDDPVEGGYKSGVKYLPPCLMSHNPLDAVIIMLGSNDTKARFGMTPMTIGQSMMQLVRTAKQYAVNEAGETAHIIIAAPPALSPPMVTLFGSPPKEAMFSWIHLSAVTMSESPRLVSKSPQPG